ncbi:MAG: HEAT repeat domain-containing protein [Chloroflexota bacterium]|nr:HEAT repeat domain-containing protein [Chloroflexota bacterium]
MLSPEFERALEVIQGPGSELPFSPLYSLSNLVKEERDRFEEIWLRLEVKRKRRVLRALIEIAEASFLVDFGALFRPRLSDEDAGVRTLAIEGLWEDGDWGLASVLIQLLQEDPAAEVRAAAATALGKFVLQGELRDRAQEQAARVCEVLFEALDPSREPLEVRQRALESLAYVSDDRVPDLIQAAYDHEEAKMRASALFAMGRSADTRWAPIVLEELRSSDPKMRYEAARACGELQLAQAVPRLRELARDRDREVQETAIWALGQIGGPEARRILEARHEQGDEFICKAMEEALANVSLLDQSFSLAYHELLDEELQGLEDLEESCFYRREK